MANNTEMANHIRKLRKARSITLDTLAERTGLSTSFLSRLESGGRGAGLESYVKISRALEVPVAQLTDEYSEEDALDRVRGLVRSDRRIAPVETVEQLQPSIQSLMLLDVPVYGTVAASGVGNGAFRLGSDIVDWAARPPGLAGAVDLYALEVKGDSMFPKFEPGDIVYVHPHRAYRPGDAVVIQDPASDNGEPQSFIKIFRRETATDLVVSQYNPVADLTFKKRNGLIVHKVMTNRELFGS